MSSGGVSPALLEAAYDAKQRDEELLLMELPILQQCAGEGPPSATRPVASTGDFLFRLLTFGEFDTFSKLAKFGDVAELVLKATVVFPKAPWEEHPLNLVEAGVYEEAAALIIETSGFEAKSAMFANLNLGRQLSNTIYGAAHMFICKAFPGMDPRSLSRMSMPEMFRFLAMSEQMLAVEGKPTEFPLRGFFSGKHRVQGGPFDVPGADRWSRLPTYSEMQLDAMKAGDRAAAVARANEDRRALAKDPEARANRSVEIRRRKMEELARSRALDQAKVDTVTSEELAREFRR